MTKNKAVRTPQIRHGTVRALVSQRTKFDSIAFATFLAVLVWAPLPLGSNRSWAVAVLAAALCSLLTAVLLSRLITGTDDSNAGEPLRGARFASLGGVFLVVFALIVLLQCVSLPAGVLGWLREPSGDPGVQNQHTLSVDPFATRQYLLVALACTAGFFLTVLLVHTRSRLQVMLTALVVSGALQAVIAIWLVSQNTPYELLFSRFSAGSRASGTFANADHLAGYLELCLSAGVGLMLSGMGGAAAHAITGKQRAMAALQFLMSWKMVVRLLLVMMVIALVMSHSRMGNGAFFVSLLLTGCLCAIRSPRLRPAAMWLVASLVVVDVIVVGQWVGLDKVVQRLDSTPIAKVSVAEAAAGVPGAFAPRKEESIEERVLAARYALQMLPQRPWLGHGGGTFYTAFPLFKGDEPLGFYDHAHNDYVEISADMGLVGMALLSTFALCSLWRAVRAVNDQHASLTRGAAAGVVMGVSCIGLHSLVDFNLQIPATALTFTVLMALAWRLPAGRKAARRAPKKIAFNRFGTGSLAFVSLAAAVWVSADGFSLVRIDWVSRAAVNEALECDTAGKNWDDPKWKSIETRLEDGLSIRPDNPNLHDLLGKLYACRGIFSWNEVAPRTRFFNLARRQHEAALRIRPAHAASWANLAVALQASGAGALEVNTAAKQALRYAPNETPIITAMADLVLRTWDLSGPDLQNWLRSTLTTARPDRKAMIIRLASLHRRLSDLQGEAAAPAPAGSP